MIDLRLLPWAAIATSAFLAACSGKTPIPAPATPPAAAVCVGAKACSSWPLQQYLIKFPDGRLQALSIAWDSRPAQQGGQRWFHTLFALVDLLRTRGDAQGALYYANALAELSLIHSLKPN